MTGLTNYNAQKALFALAFDIAVTASCLHMYFEFILIQTKGAIATWFLCTVLIMEASLLQFIFIIVIEPPPTVLIIEVSIVRHSRP